MLPEGIETTLFPRVYRRLQACDIDFDRWQRGFGRAALGLRADGKFASTVGGNTASIPRQVGKTFTIGNLVIGLCLEIPGMRVTWTSHHNRTTTNTFRSMQGMVRRKKVWPHIERNGIRTANGEQEIRFANGSIIMFGAREQGFGRGMDAIDIEIFDEAQILSLKALEDMVPATNQARNPHGGLVFFIGTPPRPSDDGEAFTSKRAAALVGKLPNGMYVEISADDDADPYDESIYPTFNPSYPHRTPIEAMQRMLANIPDLDAIRREMLGIWPKARDAGAIDHDLWRDQKVDEPELTERVAFGAYTNLPRTRSAIGAATYTTDDKILVEIVPAADGVEYHDLPGTSWIPPRLAALAGKWSPVATVVDGYSSAASLLPDMEELGLEMTVTQAKDMARACGMVYDALVEGRLVHLGQDGLTKAALSAKWRELSDSRAWDRKDKSSDITELVAITLAVYGLIVHGGEQKEVEVWGFYE